MAWMQDEFEKNGVMGKQITDENSNIGSPTPAGIDDDDDEDMATRPLLKDVQSVSFDCLSVSNEAAFQPTPKQSIFVQCGPLLLREFRALYRDTNALYLCFIVCGVLYTTLGVIFWQRGELNEDGKDKADYDPKSHFGAIMMAMVGFMFSNMQPVMITFPNQRPVFMREYAAGLYSTIPYILSRFLVDCLVTATTSLFAWLLAFWMMGLNGNFFYFWFITFLLGMAASSMGLVLGSCVSTGRKALLLSPLILVPNILFAGFYLPLQQIVVAIRWIQWICFLGYSVKLLVIAEFAWADKVADRLETMMNNIDEYTAGEAPDEVAMMTTFRNTIDPLFAAGVKGENDGVEWSFEHQWWMYLLILISIILFFRSLTSVILAYKGRQSVQ
jgi:hypothetical protein